MCFHKLQFFASTSLPLIKHGFPQILSTLPITISCMLIMHCYGSLFTVSRIVGSFSLPIHQDEVGFNMQYLIIFMGPVTQRFAINCKQWFWLVNCLLNNKCMQLSHSTNIITLYIPLFPLSVSDGCQGDRDEARQRPYLIASLWDRKTVQDGWQLPQGCGGESGAEVAQVPPAQSHVLPVLCE